MRTEDLHVLRKMHQDFQWYYNAGYITSRDGNACVKTVDGQYLVTPSGVSKQALKGAHVIVDATGKPVYATDMTMKPSIETKAHLDALTISGANASVHVHSPNTVALISAAREHDDKLIYALNNKWPELFRYTAVADVVPFLEPGSQALHDQIASNLSASKADIVIMKRHGVLAIGENLEECREHIHRLEHVSAILLNILTATGGKIWEIL